MGVQARPVVDRERDDDDRGRRCGHRPPGKAVGWAKHHRGC
jgi:hypothetical protein